MERAAESCQIQAWQAEVMQAHQPGRPCSGAPPSPTLRPLASAGTPSSRSASLVRLKL